MIAFREKSLWVSLFITVIVAMAFSSDILHLLSLGADAPASNIVSILLKATVFFVVLEIVLHILLAMDEQIGAGEREDEREKQFRLAANHLGYWVLSIGVIACIIQQLINSNVEVISSGQIPNFIQAPLELKLIIIFWLSEICRFSAELYHFRKYG